MSSETQTSALPLQLPPPKFSRYRSVRQANGIKAASSPTLPFQIATAPQHASVARSQSRYHKNVRSADTAAEAVADQRARSVAHLYSHSASLAALTGESYAIPTVQHTQNNAFKALSKDDALPSISTPIKSITRPARRPNPSPAVASEKTPQGPQSCFDPDPIMVRNPASETETNEEAREKPRAEEDRLRRIKAKQNAAQEFVRSKRIALVDMTRLEGLPYIERDAGKAVKSTSQGIGPSLSIRRDGRTQGPALEAKIVSPNQPRNTASNDTKIRNSREGRRQDPAIAELPPPAIRNLLPHRKLAQPTQRGPPPPNQQPNTPAEAQPFRASVLPLKPSESGPVTSDIPRSAVNAGERRVVVKYNESVVSLPITPTTTTQDLLNFASTSMSSSFESQQSALSESFTQLGLERPLRTYERIRDVLNSWDYDAQNHLVVLTTSANVLSKGDVNSRALPKKPGGTSLCMYHSQRPGKWDKRWVSLKEDGQISISKRQDGSQSSSLCHLSDFDIYKPTQRQIKKLRSPKKVCFAIKSQQKSVMFLNGANFVHFFATSDGPLTETWYSAVRTWRSWYLVNVLGEGQGQANRQISSQECSAGAWTMAPRTSGQNQPVSPHRGKQSALRMPKADSPNKATPRTPVSEAMQNRDLCEVSLRGCSVPPSSFPNHQIHRPDPSVPSSGSRHPSSLVRGGERTASMRSSVKAPSSLRRSTSLSRAGSICRAAKPLVDLTPQFQEQPQHIRKGRGVAAVPGKPLIEFATDVEVLPGAITIPAARAWQRIQDPPLGPYVGAATAKKTSGGFAEPPSYDLAFTGTGLLSRNKSKRTQGGIGHGYGIRTGDRNHVGEPLMDLRLGSQFADGSLLRQVETLKGEDERGLIVDRSKKVEKDVRVGEGV